MSDFKHDVFISYAHADTEEGSDRSPAAALAAMLEAEGYTVWWDRELIVGDDWLRELPANIGLARKVVALVSPRWIASKDCYAEMMRAYETPGKLLPVLIADCEPPKPIAQLNAVRAVGNIALAKPLILAALAIDPSRRPAAAIPTADPARVQLTLPSGTSRLFGRDVELTILDNAWTGTTKPKPNVVVFHAIGGAGKSALVRHFVDGLARKGYPTAAKVYGWSAYSQGSGDNRDTANAEGFIADALAFFGHDLAANPITDATERGRTLARLVRSQRTLLILDGLEPLQDQPLVNNGRLKDRGLEALIKALADDNPGLLIITSRQELPELANHGLVLNKALDQLDARAGAALLQHLGVHGREADLTAAVAELGGHALSVNLLGTYLASVCAGDITRRDTLRFDEMTKELEELGTDETARRARRARVLMKAYEARFAALAQGGSAGKGAVELMLLRLVGLFNRPAEPGALAAILAAPPIPGLTDVWHTLTPRQQQSQWGFAQQRLRKLRLLLSSPLAGEVPRRDGGGPLVIPSPRLSRGEGGGEGQPPGAAPVAAPHPDPLPIAEKRWGEGDALDAHPVVRQHFGAELARTAPDAFREANLRLYRYYAALPEKQQPDTLVEMEPLFHAIAHGCAAGLHQEVFDEVYWKRVLRGNDKYIVHQLGAFSADLGALANFFSTPWSTPHPSLTASDQAVALGYAAFALRALGRLRDAAEPMAAAAELHVARKNSKFAAAEYSNLSGLRLTLGDVAAAMSAGRETVTHADTSGDEFHRMLCRTTLADALHQAGDVAAAEHLFREAEVLQAKRQPGLDRLYSVWGYHFCDLLLARGAAEEVVGRYAWLVSVRQPGDSLLDRGLEELIAGRAAHALALPPLPALRGEGRGEGQKPAPRLAPAPHPSPLPAEERGEGITTARRHLDGAVEGLRKAGSEHHIPRGLLARAAFRRDTGDLAGAQQDLTDAHEIADRGGMRLFLTDYYLEWGRLVLAHDPALAHPDSRRHAEACFAAARDLIAATGYHRRDRDLAALRTAIDSAGAPVQ